MEQVRAVVRHEDDLAREEWDDPVRGELGFQTVFSAGTTPTSGLTAGLAVLSPGGWLGAHQHRPAEIYHVLEGRGLVLLGGVEHEVRAGSSVFIPGDAEHGIRNTGTSRLRVFYAFTADSFADVQYRFPAEG
jgi:mannose-6-phosphate isomerase-like protein (cupin superfamily)